MTAKICVGQFAGSHGVRGLVKLRSFTAEPADVMAYGPLTDEAGSRRFTVTLQGMVKDNFLAKVDGVTSREQAQALAGVRLYVDRAALPETEDGDEFYHADLIGLRAELVDGTLYGTVKAVYDFGAGDMLEIRIASGALEMLPFSKACVPVVDVRAGRVVVDLPAVIEAREGSGDEAEEGEGDSGEEGP
ncbi:16S rRNA-processing protein RimM [Azospirillum thiophilum]|uniref:Ribosome maturation factor RimM n=1 Tax=Azospirillum thiophilum TaxID=528244 RepID=A0AAC8VUQ1_9PROT|nr:ribosome maturation factor RimM [Azospirillum thiophilum]ALG69867.1 16S rRNA-processing protein RimM [Azospirillum thiophilum]KJR66449.1 16S rRNA-processing protein RimM [Azospirillum thiophilum]